MRATEESYGEVGGTVPPAMKHGIQSGLLPWGPTALPRRKGAGQRAEGQRAEEQRAEGQRAEGQRAEGQGVGQAAVLGRRWGPC